MKRETRLMRRRTELMFQVVTARGIFLSSCPALCRASTSCVHRVFKDVDGRDKCTARRHPRQVFGDMTDTSSWHGFDGQGGDPCRGARCRSWTSGASLLSWRVWKGQTGESCVGGSEFIPRRLTNGLSDGRPMGSLWIDHAGPMGARDRLTT